MEVCPVAVVEDVDVAFSFSVVLSILSFVSLEVAFEYVPVCPVVIVEDVDVVFSFSAVKGRRVQFSSSSKQKSEKSFGNTEDQLASYRETEEERFCYLR